MPMCDRRMPTKKRTLALLFPNEEIRRAACLMALGIHQHKMSGLAICEQHFNHQDFCTSKNGLRTLKTDAIPLVVQTCAICLDTDSQLYSLSIHKLEEAYTNLTGLSYDGNLSRALCAACAQRLISCSTLRDRSLMARSLLMELVETDSLTIQNIKLKREKIFQTPNLDEKIFQPNHYDINIQENIKYNLMEDNSLINNEIVNKNERREALNAINNQFKRGLMLDYAPIVNEVNKNETELANTTHIEVKRELETEIERIETLNAINSQLNRGLIKNNAPIVNEVNKNETELANETHIEVKRELETEIERIETLNAKDSQLKRYLTKTGPNIKNKVVHTDERIEIANENHIEVKRELETEDERIETLNAMDRQLKFCRMTDSAVINNEFVDQNNRRETSNGIIQLKHDLIKANTLIGNEVDKDETELANESHIEVKRELETADERIATLNAIDSRLKRCLMKNEITNNEFVDQNNRWETSNGIIQLNHDLIKANTLIGNEVDKDETELANESHIEVKCELETADERIANLNAIDSRLKRCLMKNEITNNEFVDQNNRWETSNGIIQLKHDLMKSNVLIDNEVDKNKIIELRNESNIEVKRELETEDERIETLSAIDSRLKRCLMKNEITNNEFVNQNNRWVTSNGIIQLKHDLMKSNVLIDNEVDKDEIIELRNESNIEVKRELETEDERIETSNAIDIQLKFEEFEDVLKEEICDGFNIESEFDNANEVNETSMMEREYFDGNNLGNYANRIKCTDCYEEFEDEHIYNEHYVLCHNDDRASKIEPRADISMNQYKTRRYTSRGNANTIDSHRPEFAGVNPNRIPESNIGFFNQAKCKRKKIADTILVHGKEKRNPKCDKSKRKILNKPTNKNITDNLDEKHSIDINKRVKKEKDIETTEISDSRITVNDNVDERQSIDTDKTDNEDKDIETTKISDTRIIINDNVDAKQSIDTDKTDNKNKDIETTKSDSRITNKKFACNKCNFETNHENYLKCHLILHSSNVNAKNIYKCNQCPYITNMEQNLATHLTVHSGVKPYTCKTCEYSTAIKRNLISHNRTHTGEKPYSCNQCSYKCSVKYYLISHMRVHAGDYPYTCKICDYKCNIQRKLTRHLKTHAGEKPYTCDVCNIKCSQQSNLRAHMRIHTGEKPFSCTVCEYRSTKKCSLDRHIRVHTGEKPYSCTVCTHKTTTQYNLTIHMRSHTGEKPFACSLCDIRYCRLKHLAKHMKTHG